MTHAASELFCDWASSGQSVCQSLGLSSLRVTRPFVANSINNAFSIGTGLFLCLQLLIEGKGTPVHTGILAPCLYICQSRC